MSDARISYLELDEASDQVKQVYSAVESNFGQVLNLIKIAGHSPPALNGMMSLFGSLQKCSLKDHLRELAYLKVSHVNECEY